MNEVTLAHEKTPSGLLRARGLGIPLTGCPGRFNAITDVSGVEVGYSTIIRGEGKLIVGRGPVRTGVTAILPRGRGGVLTPVFAGYYALNGVAELTGSNSIEEVGRCDGPITITNTHSCGTARDASIKWMIKHTGLAGKWILPVATETADSWLNDINGFHVHDEHVFEAINSACGGPIEEGSIGGGTGMICYKFKGGSGTSSRVVEFGDKHFVIGTFVQANFGRRKLLTIAGVPVGRHLPVEKDNTYTDGDGSIVVVVATDAPLLPHQLKRMARRASLGVGRSGTISDQGSGDILLAFSTANPEAFDDEERLASAQFVPNRQLNEFFGAVIETVDEAILNALIANKTMVGANNCTVPALPHKEVKAILERYNRLR